MILTMPPIILFLYALLVILALCVGLLGFRLYAVQMHVKRLKKIIMRLEGELDNDPEDEAPTIGMND